MVENFIDGSFAGIFDDTIALDPTPLGASSRSKKRGRDIEADLAAFADLFESGSKRILLNQCSKQENRIPLCCKQENKDDEVISVLFRSWVVPASQVVDKPEPELQYPFFNYKNFSTVIDVDPQVPLTPPGRVPNFPAKMHAILSRPDLKDIVTWMPHGRSWRVLRPRQFEIRVIPTYFEHSKFSSFVRQANGWGFRRISHGEDRNSYYHPQFLRGLPHLCKNMRRPGISEKQPLDPEHEPDLYKISAVFPVPEKNVDESILLECVIKGGPKARVPVLTCNTSAHSSPSSSCSVAASCTAAPIKQLTPSDQQIFVPFQQSLGVPENKLFKSQVPAFPGIPAIMLSQPGSLEPRPLQMPLGTGSSDVKPWFPLALADHPAFSPSMADQDYEQQLRVTGSDINTNMRVAPTASSNEFSAGFNAAASLSQEQACAMLEMMQQGLFSDNFFNNYTNLSPWDG